MIKLFEDIYGCFEFDVEKYWLGILQNSEMEFFDYFKDRPGDLLVINIASGDGWDKLCLFSSKKYSRYSFSKGECHPDRVDKYPGCCEHRKTGRPRSPEKYIIYFTVFLIIRALIINTHLKNLDLFGITLVMF